MQGGGLPADPRLTLVVAAIATALSFAVNVREALQNPFWTDEVASARVVTTPTTGAAITLITHRESTPPGWYALAWALHRAGISIMSVRVTSAVCVALLAGLVVIVAGRLMPLYAASVAGALVVFGTQFVFHGRELRAYALFALICMVFMIALVGAVNRPGAITLLMLSCSVAIGALTHYFFLAAVLVGLVWLTIIDRPRPVRLRALAAMLAGLLFLAAWWPHMTQQITNDRYAGVGQFSLRELGHVYWRFYAAGLPGPAWLGVGIMITSYLVVISGAVILWRISDEGRLVAMLAGGSVLLATLAGLVGVEVFDVRNLLGSAPFAAICLAAVVARIPRPFAYPTAAIVAGLAIFGYAHTSHASPAPFDRIATALLAESWHPGQPIAAIGHGYPGPLGWYLNLPGAPRTHRLGAGRCRPIFIVGPRALAHALDPTPSEVRTVGAFAVERDDSGAIRNTGIAPRLVLLGSGSLPCAAPPSHS